MIDASGDPTRIVLVGSGSIARRHLEVLRALLPRVTIGLVHRRSPADVPKEIRSAVDELFDGPGAATGWAPAAALVANAAPAHVASALPFIDAGIPTFMEKPLSTGVDGVEQLVESRDARGAAVLVGYCLRYHPPLRRLRELVSDEAIGRPLHLRASVGQHLELWRPGTDYRSTVSARRELGGGALLELSHELDLARWILGDVAEATGWMGRLGDLDIDVEDTVEVLLRFHTGAVGSIHLDMLRRPPRRECTVVGTGGTLRWDGDDDRLRLWTTGTGEWREVDMPPFDRSTLYTHQMQHFLDCAAGRSDPEVTLEDAIEVLRTCDAVRAADDQRAGHR